MEVNLLFVDMLESLAERQQDGSLQDDFMTAYDK